MGSRLRHSRGQALCGTTGGGRLSAGMTGGGAPTRDAPTGFNNAGFNGIGAVYFHGNAIWREGRGWVPAFVFTGAGSSRE